VKIAVLGPPGVEKSKFARAIAHAYDLHVIDNYIQRLQKKTALALGPWSSYGELFMVAGVRESEEAKKARVDTITVGTILDSLVYASTHVDVALHDSEEGRRASYIDAQAAMQGLALWYREAYMYHIAFHLPYSREQITSRGRTWETALDSAYPLVLESFEAPFTYTLAGDTKNRIKVAKEIIDVARNEDQPEEAETSTPDE
jgi:deoxyadenosine/deoxycytidine kinase